MTINGSQVSNLKSFYEKIWKSGEAGVTIKLRVLRKGKVMNFNIKTVDRMDYFVKPQSFQGSPETYWIKPNFFTLLMQILIKEIWNPAAWSADQVYSGRFFVTF